MLKTQKILLLHFLATNESGPSAIFTLIFSAHAEYEKNRWYESVMWSNTPESIIQWVLCHEVFKTFRKVTFAVQRTRKTFRGRLTRCMETWNFLIELLQMLWVKCPTWSGINVCLSLISLTSCVLLWFPINWFLVNIPTRIFFVLRLATMFTTRPSSLQFLVGLACYPLRW